MKTFTKVALVTGLVTLVLGASLFIVGMAATGGDGVRVYYKNGFHVDEDRDVVEQERTEIESFKNAKIDMSEASVHFYESDDDKFYVEYRLHECFAPYALKVKNDTFEFSDQGDCKFVINLNMFNFDSDDLYLNIYYPKGTEFGDLSIDNSAGSVTLEDELTCHLLDIDASAGSVNVANMKGALKADLSAGSLILEDCDLGFCDIDMSAGSFELIDCTMAGGKVDMSAGKFKSTGFTLTDDLSLDMSAGNVTIEFVDGQKIGYDFDISAGSAKINGEKRGDEFEQINGYDIILTVDSSAGSVDITNN